jgi:hypothetical protein
VDLYASMMINIGDSVGMTQRRTRPKGTSLPDMDRRGRYLMPMSASTMYMVLRHFCTLGRNPVVRDFDRERQVIKNNSTHMSNPWKLWLRNLTSHCRKSYI